MTGKPPYSTSTLHVAMVVLDGDGRISWFGSEAEELTGFARTEVIGLDPGVLSDNWSPPQGQSFVDLVKDGDLGMGRVRRADGTTVPIITHVRTFTAPDGTPATLIVVFDVAQLRDTETNIAVLDAFFHQSLSGFAILDSQLRFVMVNEALARLSHRSIDDHIGRPIREVISSADLDTYEDMLRTVQRTGTPIHNLRLPGNPTSAPGEARVWAVSWYRLTDWQDEGMGLCGIISDVTADEQATLQASRHHARHAILDDIGAKQVATLDFGEHAQDLTELLVSEYCDLAFVDVVQEVISGESPPSQTGESTEVSRIGAAAHTLTPAVTRLIEVENPRPAMAANGLARAMAGSAPLSFRVPDDIDLAADLVVPACDSPDAKAAGTASVLMAPLRTRDTTLGVLTCVRLAERDPFDDNDLSLMCEIAKRTALSIDKSRLYRDEKQAALILQMNLLPHHLPNIPEATMTYRYRPNRTTLHAGGDWFDSIVLPGRRVAFVVGDVAGHGITAAATMGRYRTAVRSLASVGLQPSALLTRLNNLAMDFGENAMATCLFVQYDPLEGFCIIANAGHPPPVFAIPGNSAEPYEFTSGPLLGALPDAEYTASSISTPPGTRILLYSDGIVESRVTPLDDGIARVTRQMQSEGTLGAICDTIMDSAPDDTLDDRTVLLAEFHGLSPHLLRKTD